MADMKKYRDEAASLMGQYLLKGYKMLATHCLSCGVRTYTDSFCKLYTVVHIHTLIECYPKLNYYLLILDPCYLVIQTVLLQKKGEKELCVLCQEILPKSWQLKLIVYADE